MHKRDPFQLSHGYGRRRLLVLPLLTATLASRCALGLAQAPPAAGKAGNVIWNAEKFVENARGIRLEGHAVITTPGMTVTAPLIELNRKGGASITEIRGHQSVSFKMNTTPRPGALPIHIDVHSNEAVADLVKSTLVLTGSVDGEYAVGRGRPNRLRGRQATLTLVNQSLNVDVEGGTEGVRLELPPEELAAKPPPPAGRPVTAAPAAALGTVVITSQRATLNTVLTTEAPHDANAKAGAGNPGTARFVGNARAVSTDGPTKFDVSASEFLLTRVVTGSIETLKTVGRTHLLVDFPPPPATEPPVAVAIDAAGGKEPNAGKVAPKPNRMAVGRPTHVEADADALTVIRPTDTMVLTGSVKGFYRLPPPEEPAPVAGQGPAEPRDFHFTEDRVQLHYDATQGVEIEGEGNPGIIETPGFDMKFGQ